MSSAGGSTTACRIDRQVPPDRRRSKDAVPEIGALDALAVLLVVAVHGLFRFTLDDDTHARIITGLLLTVVVLWDGAA